MRLIILLLLFVALSVPVYAFSLMHSQRMQIGNKLDMLEIGESIGSVTPVLSYPPQVDKRMAALYAQSATTKSKFNYRFKNRYKTLK